jgi:hypothetical protein
MLPLVGTLFEMPNGQKIVQFAHPRPKRPLSEWLFLEFMASAGQISHYETLFDDIASRSFLLDEMIVTGTPSRDGRSFVPTRIRNRQNVFRGSGADEWIAAVIVLLWYRDSRRRPRPLLQVRTPENSRRELNHLSNLSGYLNAKDMADSPLHAPLDYAAPLHAAVREIAEELSPMEGPWSPPRITGVAPYYHGDPRVENFFFFVCESELLAPPTIVPHRAMLREWSFKDLLDIRRFQVLTKTETMLEDQALTQLEREYSAHALRLNLIAHGDVQFANELDTVVKTRAPHGPLAEKIKLARGEGPARYVFERGEREIIGLAGLQYREFFSIFVPAYARLGMEGAAECLERVRSTGAIGALREHYWSAHLVRSARFDA